MSYKVGDRVVIRKNIGLHSVAEAAVQRVDRTVTIKKIIGNNYIFEGMSWHWEDSHIEGLALGPESESETITRFELMDL